MEAPQIKRYLWLNATFLATLMLLLGMNSALAESEIRSGTTFIVASGITVTEYGSVDVKSGGTIDNQGTMVVKKNLVNGNATASNLGTGLFEFSGTAAQTISGPNVFGSVTLNNANGLTLLTDQRINGVLTLTSGRIALGTLSDKNLLMGPSATLAGSPSASAMVVATGTGEMRKEFSGAGSFTFPVGDIDNTIEYSPVSATFTTGSFGAGNYLGVKLTNQPDPNPLIATGDYINRYWELTSSNITGTVSCGLAFTFTDADLLAGAKANLYCLKTSPVLETYDKYASSNLLTGTVSSFGRFTGANPAHEISLIAFLEGPYVSGAMSTTLKTTGRLPLTQPYNTSPWNYTGTESVLSIPADVVDWVLIELRQAATVANATGSTVIKTRAAFITSNGTIVDMDGVNPVKFYGTEITTNLFPVVKHRNHLSVMAGNIVSKINGIYSYNFSSAQTQIYDGTGNGCILLGSKWGMIAGNAVGDRTINNTDYVSWQANFGLSNYNPADFNFTGSINNSDYTIWQKNFSLTTKVPN